MRPEVGRERQMQRIGLTLALGLDAFGAVTGERILHRHDCLTLAAHSMDIATTRVLPTDPDADGAVLCSVCSPAVVR